MASFDPRTVHTMPGQQFGTPRPDAPQFGTGQFSTQGFPGRQFPGPVPPPSRAKRPMAAKIVAGLVAAGLVVGGAGTWMALSSSSAEAAVQSTSFAGADPTTNPFGTDAPQVAAVAATGPQTGDTKGLYAATTPPACTTADFLSQLQADPAKLAAFGGVFGLGASDVPAFVNSLSPVVLRANTSVTDHPYAEGAFTEQPAVLAAGTAVLVNSYGEPTVKCFNGNPLTAGAAASDAVTITPTTQVIAQFSFTTIDNSRVVVIPGKPDPKPIPGPNPTTTPQPDPELVTKAQEAKAAAEQARSEATTARANADAKDAEARRTASALTQAEADLAQAQKDGNPTVIAELTKVRDDAKAAADTAANQAKYADSAARSAEGVADQADRNAKDAQDKADQSAKAPAPKEEQKNTITKVENDPTAAGQEGQTPAVAGQTQPATGQTSGTPVCAKIVTDATATPDCPATGSADSATKPAAKPATGTTTTGSETGTSSTGSAHTGAKDSGSASSSSTSSSQGGSKEGYDK